MGDLKLVSSFSEFGFVPKFKKGNVSCKRDFPVAFDQLREGIKLKSEQGCSDSYALASMKEEVEVKRGVNNCIRPDIKPSEPILRRPMDMPKKRRFSAVRDFPDGFKVLNGQKGSSKEANVSIECIDSAVDDIKPIETVFEHPTSSSGLQFDILSGNFEIRKSSPSLELPNKDFGFLSRDFEFDMKVPLISSGQEVEQQLVSESSGPLTQVDGENWDIICQTEGLKKPRLEDGLYQAQEQKTTIKKMHSGMLPRTRRVLATRDFPDSFLHSSAGCTCTAEKFTDKDGGYVVDDDEEPFEDYMLHLRDEGANVSEDDKKPLPNELRPLEVDSFSNSEKLGCKFPLRASSMDEFVDAGILDQSGFGGDRISKVIGCNKNESEQYSGKTCIQRRHLGSEGQEHRVIVQALMASSRCSWRSQRIIGAKSEGLKKSK